MEKAIDPLKLIKTLWPDIVLYDKQVEILYSVWENHETVVPAGNMLGKDYIAGLVALSFFLSRRQCRVVTTSVDQHQLEKVLWGEIRQFLQDAKTALPLKVNYCDIKKIVGGVQCPKSYLTGRVASKDNQGAGLLGHHLPRGGGNMPTTLAIVDEASGFTDDFKTKLDTWAHRVLVIGNPYPCENFFKHAVKGVPGGDPGGDVEDPNGGYYRKVIKIKATDSPNVKLAEKEIAAGKTPSKRILVPGVKDYDTYVMNRKMWDAMKQCISLDAEFYEGADVMLYPPAWLRNSAEIASQLLDYERPARVIGVDPAEGGDKSSWAVGDELGLMDLRSLKTPDTTDIVDITLELMREYLIDPRDIWFDAGGGGKQHADRLRKMGYPVKTVAFGESATLPRKRSIVTFEEKQIGDEERYVYKNRRAEMYGTLRLRMDPQGQPPPNFPTYRPGFGIPGKYVELHRQLSVIPLWYDGEGRLELPPKNRTSYSQQRNRPTMVDLVGHSPDEADALAILIYGLHKKSSRFKFRATN